MQDAQQPSTPNQEPKGLAAALDEIATLRNENKILREKLDAILRKLYRASSEQLDPSQLLLLLAGLDQKAQEPVEPA